MNYLRLSSKTNKVNEFYIDDIPAKYLSDIKDLNIMIGANNTRKSRFMRHIIGIDHKVIVSSDHDINKLFHDVNGIFEGLSDNFMNANLISFIFNKPSDNTLRFHEIGAYFAKKLNEGTNLTFTTIKDSFQSLQQTIDGVATDEQIATLSVVSNRAHEVFNLTLSIFKSLQSNYSQFRWDSPNPTNVPGITYKINVGGLNQEIDQLDEKVMILESVFKQINVIQELKIRSYYIDMIYIPVLRTSRKLSGGTPDLFKKTVQQQHKIEDNGKLSIETGLDLYDKIEVARNGHRRERERFAAFEKFISDVFFQSNPIDIIAVKSSSEVERHVKLSIEGEQDDIAIHDLGDGIQGIINLLLPVFTAQDGSWIFIDEPENHLHPGYQNVFMNAISINEIIRNKKLKFFINTHSNHILSEALLSPADTEILVFSRRDKDASDILTFNGNEYATLEMLGVFNTSVLISNCTVWVEGVTDRLYLKAFMFAYYNSKETKSAMPVEGLHFSFIEYSGNNLIHYNFDHDVSSTPDENEKKIKAFFINSNVFLLADSDFVKEEKHQFYKDQEKRNNFKYFQTELPEIENLLPEEILKIWLADEVKCTATEIDDCFKVPIGNEKLGAYFHEKFTYRKNWRKFMTPAEGGTLRADLKKRLADFVYTGIMNKTIMWDMLKTNDILNRLVTELDDFIRVKSHKGFTDVKGG